MSKTIIQEYFHYSGTGNTFALMDDRQNTGADWTALAPRLCDEANVDGLLIMENSNVADVRMRIINRDGSEAEMCGNGSRCAAHWAKEIAGLPAQFKMETLAGVLEASVFDQDIVKIRLTDPRDLRAVEALEVDFAVQPTYYLDTGVPHAVIEVQDISALDIAQWGPWVRNHEQFKPRGTNASFYQNKGNGKIDCRVYERGVEGETQSCGTGSTACALVAAIKHQYDSPIQVQTTSRDLLNIYFSRDGDVFSNIYLEGPVKNFGKKNWQS